MTDSEGCTIHSGFVIMHTFSMEINCAIAMAQYRGSQALCSFFSPFYPFAHSISLSLSLCIQLPCTHELEAVPSERYLLFSVNFLSFFPPTLLFFFHYPNPELLLLLVAAVVVGGWCALVIGHMNKCGKL